MNHSSASTGGIDFPEDTECFASNMHRTPEVGLNLVSGIGVGDFLGITHQTVASVVDEDVDSMEFIDDIGNCFGDCLWTGDVEVKFENCWAVWEVGERFNVACCGYDAVTGVVDFCCEGFSDTG